MNYWRQRAMHDTITRTFENLSPRGLCDVTVQLHAGEFRIPAGADPVLWSAPVGDLVDQIHKDLSALPAAQDAAGSPLEQAEAAKQSRDLAGELGALMGGAAALQQQPWYPARPGDVVHIAYEAFHDLPGSGSTYLVGQNPDEAGFLTLVAVAVSDTDGGCWATDGDPDPLFELWMEAGGHRITVVRDGAVVHNGPAGRGR
jgi:hypothetical protein